MKLLLIHPHDIFSPNEPWTIRIKAIANELRKLGHEITLVTFTLDGFIDKPFTQDGIKIICLKRKLSLKYFFQKMKIISNLAKENEVVYFQKCFHYASVPAVISAIIHYKKLHYDWDDYETGIFFSGEKTPSFIIGFFMYLLEKFLPLIADSISVSSDFIMQKAIKSKKDKRFLIKVPVGAYPSITKENNILKIKDFYKLNNIISQIYIGQLHGAQYAELLIKTCKKLKEFGLVTKTLIVGDGYDKNRLEKIVHDLNLDDEIIFTGFIPHEEITDYLKACDIAIACFENNNVTKAKSPLKIAEYLAAGKVIVAHNVGEVFFMLNNAGIIVPFDDENGLFKAIKEIHKNPQNIKTYEELSLLQSKHFTWEESAKRIHNLFLQIYS